MTRGFLLGIARIGLLAVLLLTTIVNCWQNDRTEQRFIDLQDEVKQLNKALASGTFSSAGSANGGPPTGGIHGEAESPAVLAALADPANILDKDPVPWLPPNAQLGDTLSIHLGSDPKGFNFLAENGADVTEIQEFVTLPLIKRHKADTTKWGPAYAYSMVSPDDGQTYIFKLRENIYWHEPLVDWASGEYEWLRGDHQVTADDVVFMMDMLMDPQVTKAAPLRSYFDDLESYEAVDKFTFQVKFKRKVFSQRSVAIPSMFPVPKFLYAHDVDGTPFDAEILGQKFQDHWYNPNALGCGPYKFVRFEPGVAVELARNPKYPLGGNAFETIVYRILTDQNQPPRQLRTKELHLAYLQPGQYRTEVLEGADDSPFKNGELTAGEWWEHSWFYIGWNMRRPIFQDKRVRKAMSHAFNGDLLLSDVFMDLGERNSGPMPRFLPWYDQSIDPIPFDLDAARALLDEAGWVDTNDDGIRDKEIDGRRVEFDYSLMMYGSSDEYRTLGNIFKEDLAQIGVKMNPTPVEWSNLLKKVNDREFDAVTLAWVGGPEVEFNQIWHSSEADKPKSSNHVGFKNAEADAIIEEMNTAFGFEERKALAHRFHALLHEEQPYTFFYTRKRPAFWQKDLSNVKFAQTRPYRNHKAWHLGQ